MKTIGRVDVPQEAFVAALSTGGPAGDKAKKWVLAPRSGPAAPAARPDRGGRPAAGRPIGAAGRPGRAARWPGCRLLSRAVGNRPSAPRIG